MLKGSGSGLSKETSGVDWSLISTSGTLSFEDDTEVERIIAWNTVSEMARLRLRRDTGSEDFEERLSEAMEVRTDSEDVGGSGVSAGNEEGGRKTGMPKLKGLLTNEEGELSSSVGEKKLVSSPEHLGVELESSGGKGEVWRSDSATGEGMIIEESSCISTALSWSVGCSPGKIVGSCCS